MLKINPYRLRNPESPLMFTANFSKPFQRRLSPPMEIERTPLNSLSADTVGATIRVRVGRMWDSINFRTNDVFGFNLQLLDNEDGELQAVIGPRFMPLFYGKFREGLVYDISDFNVSAAPTNFLPIHKTITVHFNALTTYTEVENSCDDIPTHKFSFANYNTIVQRTDTTKLLTDVIGVLHQVGEVVNQRTKTRPDVPKQELIIYLSCGNRVAVTLWGNKTNFLSQSVLEEGTKTVILTSMTVKSYMGKPSLNSTTATCIYTDLDITEERDLIKSFRKRKMAAVINDNTHFERKSAPIMSKTLSEIISSDLPIEFQQNIFTFQGKITGVNLDNGWEYLSCNVCKTALGKTGSKNYCAKCDKDAEFPLHRYRLDLTVDDGSASASIVLFDKVAEYLIKHTADYLYAIEHDEVEGLKRVTSTLQQVIGTTETFHAKLDKFVSGHGDRRLTATRIATNHENSVSTSPSASDTKAAMGSESKNATIKVSARKKNRRRTSQQFHWWRIH